MSDFKWRGQLLPYLINRERQERKLTNAIQAHSDKSRPLLCFIHGNDNECQDKFIEKLQAVILPGLEPESNRNSIKASRFDCGDNIDPHIEELHDSMRFSLGKKLLNNPYAQLEEIAQAVVREQRLVLLYTSMYTKDWQDAGRIKLFKHFIQFWANWPHLPTQNYYLIICISFHYTAIEKYPFWYDWLKKPTLNQEIRQAFNEQIEKILQQHQVNGVILPELNSLEIKHVKIWAEEYLRECKDEIIPQIQKLFSSSEHRIPMGQLVEHLKQIQQEC